MTEISVSFPLSWCLLCNLAQQNELKKKKKEKKECPKKLAELIKSVYIQKVGTAELGMKACLLGTLLRL